MEVYLQFPPPLPQGADSSASSAAALMCTMHGCHQVLDCQSSPMNAAPASTGDFSRWPLQQAFKLVDSCSCQWRPGGGTAQKSCKHMISECLPSRASPPCHPQPPNPHPHP